MEYIIVVSAFIVIGIIVSLVFGKILKIKVFGGWVMMFLIATVGALLGSYYLPRLSNIQYIKINLSSAILGSFILVILLYIFTPKSLK
ncbi:hypothetical protein OFR22_06045 [Brachyspira hyodysenteriae]|uniref:Transglycosylase n=1 Tax=Brachyspira hyodysenteriae ATCC 27164 TaxID=1266923 RepID=A0A3B6W5T4_BRAHO|nr:hypothetical protein [Brachyspira hyodysenteriae]ANN64004.1 hypothetical protein BHYOB78_09030 [Brachyspira hyodysenteriae ATCC 27164]AUJ49609.1 hypothetical protein BH718_01166 [Brachyspira hyodysenteriae]KLI18405.1 membrane protein [Brachyspira hyodysenteriae]KLI19116.1 membrane protein [Brachyspira hyodysenteriae]KLI19958.1 membrane protein [Brachyspira hyodysenteriae]